MDRGEKAPPTASGKPIALGNRPGRDQQSGLAFMHGRSKVAATSPIRLSPSPPPAYRPQPLPIVLQAKRAIDRQPPMQSRPRPVAPQPYRPEPKKIVQPKAATLPRPTPNAQPNRASAQTQTAAQIQARVSQTPQRHQQMRKVTPRVIQQYQVLDSSKIYQKMPASKPWFGYPYAVVDQARFPAQALKRKLKNEFEFLARKVGKDEAYVTNESKSSLSLRVSNDGNMAIENSNLTRRQPKVFYATQDVVNESNRLLATTGSKFRLKVGGGKIQILTGWYSTKHLVEVSPRYYKDSMRPKKVFPTDRAPQNCNAMAAEVMGGSSGLVAARGSSKALNVAKQMAPVSSPLYQSAYNDNSVPMSEVNRLVGKLAKEYVRGKDNDSLRRLNANQFARPEVGHAFMIATIGPGQDLGGGKSRVRDYASGEDRDLSWTYHFGGVVARSGGDRVTLENYARGDNRQDNPDPRWYFQMYGESEGQSFHEFHEAKKEYANPVTISVSNT